MSGSYSVKQISFCWIWPQTVPAMLYSSDFMQQKWISWSTSVARRVWLMPHGCNHRRFDSSLRPLWHVEPPVSPYFLSRLPKQKNLLRSILVTETTLYTFCALYSFICFHNGRNIISLGYYQTCSLWLGPRSIKHILHRMEKLERVINGAHCECVKEQMKNHFRCDAITRGDDSQWYLPGAAAGPLIIVLTTADWWLLSSGSSSYSLCRDKF